MKTTQTGKVAEQACCDYLRSQGLKYIAANYRCKCGEIDLIMRDRDTLVFVEVRYRSRRDFGGALASIGNNKQNRIIKTVQHYMQNNQVRGPVRIDVVGMGPDNDEGFRFDWIRSAIQAG